MAAPQKGAGPVPVSPDITLPSLAGGSLTFRSLAEADVPRAPDGTPERRTQAFAWICWRVFYRALLADVLDRHVAGEGFAVLPKSGKTVIRALFIDGVEATPAEAAELRGRMEGLLRGAKEDDAMASRIRSAKVVTPAEAIDGSEG